MAHSGAAAGGELEEKLDLSTEVDVKIEQAKTLADSGALKEALALLTALEKRCRVGNDTTSLVKVCQAAVQHCKDCGDFESLLSILDIFSTRRSQKSAAVRAMVLLAMPWVVEDNAPVTTSDLSVENRDKLVVALRDITNGKLFLEAERARLTRALATIKEQSGDIDGAALVLQEVNVETYGSLSKKEKVEFILEQMRLTLAKQDYVRASIVSGKVSRKHLVQEDMQDYKVRFYTLMADYHWHEKNSLELAKDFHAIYSTPNVLTDEPKWREALQTAVLFLILAPYSNEQQDLMHKIKADPNLETLIASQGSLSLLLQHEIIAYPLQHQTELENFPAFSKNDLADYWKEIFHRRIVQHNIRVVSKYYKRIHGHRLAQLLSLSRETLEQEVSKMVSSGNLYAKMDRPADIIRFSQNQSPESILSDWASDIDKLLGLVEKTTHLIQKENMTQ